MLFTKIVGLITDAFNVKLSVVIFILMAVNLGSCALPPPEIVERSSFEMRTDGWPEWAKEELSQALEVDEESVSDSLSRYRQLVNYGFNSFNQGSNYSAVNQLIAAVNIANKAFGSSHLYTLEARQNLAIVFLEIGNFGKAEPLLISNARASENIFSEGHPFLNRQRLHLAKLYMSLGQFKKAETLFEEALEASKRVLGLEHRRTIGMLEYLPTLYVMSGRFAKAETLIKQYLETLTYKDGPISYGGSFNLGLIERLNQLLADAYLARGRYSEALTQLKKTEKLALFFSPKAKPSLLLGIAEVHQAAGELDKAEKVLEKVIAISAQEPASIDSAYRSGLFKLGQLYRKQGQYSETKRLWKDYLRHTNNLMSKELLSGSELTRQVMVEASEEHRNHLLSFYSNQKTSELSKEAFYYSLSRKGLLLRVSSHVSAMSQLNQNPEIIELDRVLRKKKKALAQLSFTGSREQIDTQSEEISQLEAELISQLNLNQNTFVEVEVKDVVQALNQDNVLVDYLTFTKVNESTGEEEGEQLVALVVTGGTSPAIELVHLGEMGDINDDIQSFRKNMIIESGAEFTNDASKALYEKLWAPISTSIENKSTVFVVPDGALHLLPFGALQNQHGQYLIQEKNIEILSSSRDIVLTPIRSSHTTPAIVANPAFDFPEIIDSKKLSAMTRKTSGESLRNMRFTPLPGTQREEQALSELFKSSNSETTVFKGVNATEQNLMSVQSPKILHLATHGFFLDSRSSVKTRSRGLKLTETQPTKASTPSSPSSLSSSIANPLLRSGIALTGANQGAKGILLDDGNDGILTAFEALSLNLKGTDLVVLSACDTGVGEIKQGEGVYGLRRAFQEAGAKAVLSTLWPISDDGTQEFMKVFYRRFLDGDSASKALRETQLAFIEDDRWNNPFYWAPFVLVGSEQ